VLVFTAVLVCTSLQVYFKSLLYSNTMPPAQNTQIHDM